MKKSIAIATFVVIGAGATTVAALPNPYQGSDTLFDVTQQAIPAAGLGAGSVYVGGGSGNAASAMTASGWLGGTQQTGPMSRMMKSEANICKFDGGASGGAAYTSIANASGIVVGLDAVDVLSNTASGAQATAACNATADNSGGGLVYSGSSAGVDGGVFSSGTGGVNTAQTWKWALALVYGGKDLSNSSATVDCSSQARQNLVANWFNLFQGGSSCAMTSAASAVCGAGTQVNGQLWHAFRRDDTSGTSDVFSSILGISAPNGNAISNATPGGFGSTMYCNAMNWDTSTANTGCGWGGSGATGTNNGHDQLLGPGGLPDPNSTTTPPHRMPPTGSTVQVLNVVTKTLQSKTLGDTWGRQQDQTAGFASNGFGSIWDVLPTQMQDNDPIRRPCIGTTVGNSAKAGEEVCNVDGSLGLVVPMVDTDWVVLESLGVQYPTNACDGTFLAGSAPQVFSCPFVATGKKTSLHSGECPNSDILLGGSSCVWPIDTGDNTAECLNAASNNPAVANLTTTASTSLAGDALGKPAPNGVGTIGYSLPTAPDGRIYNAHLHPANFSTCTTSAAVCYLNYAIASIPGVSVSMAGAYNRIHSTETMWGNNPAYSACQLQDMTDNIGCISQADPCSIGYAGDGAKQWYSHTGACAARGGTNCPTAANTDSMRVAQTYPLAGTVQKLGQPGEYQLSRKLYFNSAGGFSFVADTTADPAATQELTLAKFESTPAQMNTVITGNDFFTLGPQSAKFNTADAGDTQFCEDFNEQTICGAASNNNGCAANANAVIPGSSSVAAGVGLPSLGPVCGNGVLEAYEECDPGDPGAGIPAVNAGTATCSATCRCGKDYNAVSGVCN